MILLSGPTWSGKTTIAKFLEKLGYDIIPTFTTRDKRPDDMYTESISINEFNVMEFKKKFISSHTFSAQFGDVSYGIPKIPKKSSGNSVAIVAYEYIDDFKEYIENINDAMYLVYLNVPENVIIERSMKDDGRGISNSDLINRLERDRDKNQEIKGISTISLSNAYDTPYNVAKVISTEYQKFLNENVFKKLKERNDI